MWTGVERREIAANGIRFELAEAGSGPRLALLLHGFPETAWSWRLQIPLLARLGYRVWAPNLRGYGQTDSPIEVKDYAIEILVDDVAGLIAASGAQDVTLIGHDWGAMVGWFVAMRRESLIRRLVIMNVPHPACMARELGRFSRQLLRSWYVFMIQIPYLPEWLLTRNNAQAVVDAIRNMAVDKSRFGDDVLEPYRQNALRPGGMTAMLNYYRAMVSGGGGARQANLGFPTIEVPTLFIWGTEDAALDMTTTRGLEAYVRHLTRRDLPGVSHFVQQEAPEKVNAILEAWLTGQEVPIADEAPGAAGRK